MTLLLPLSFPRCRFHPNSARGARGSLRILVLGLFLGSSVVPQGLPAASNIDPVDRFAYGANFGWINLEGDGTDGVVVGEAWLSGFAHGANIGWISFGDGAPSNGMAYGNDTASDCGVNHDGTGNLSGFAYAANAGWIDFGWTSPSDPDRPRIDLLTGEFHGFAYAANLGWINLGAGYLATAGLECPDEDEDGIADWWEILHFRDLTTADETTDADHDAVLDIDEYHALSDPHDAGSFIRFVTYTALPLSDPDVEVTLEFTSNPGRLYELHASPDLATPYTEIGLGPIVADPGPTTTRTFTVPLGVKFFRAIPLKPLQP